MEDFVCMTYCSSDGSLLVDLVLINFSGDEGWDIFITSKIDFHGRKYTNDEIHLVREFRYPFICWSERINTLKQAKMIAARWVDCIALFIKGEGSFDEIAQRLS